MQVAKNTAEKEDVDRHHVADRFKLAGITLTDVNLRHGSCHGTRSLCQFTIDLYENDPCAERMRWLEHALDISAVARTQTQK